ncbi:alcohol dehydrogenase protein [Coniophora puteana RWD-64-598 SS2]|uniref:Alcohol dehydrogenase protein n=1 Tax=Coniophora puteana (strain RWD-64-598) TaxID=741705 RepID=A0A5M3MNJ1_CONPW|nr:alcohol dehydrogenase protein [Coniophora puteana RWD-64-598 SS2]EIW80617.1 alcohol dehydrogenase protein [Coniophora puteana RWD-64-598 SS2]
MTLPQTVRAYRSNREGYRKLQLTEGPLEQPKAMEVLVKVHSVSLNYRDIVIARGLYPGPAIKDNVIPCSDMAGEIVALGTDVEGWEVGARVSANFSLTHLDGDPSAKTRANALGAPIDGVLREYMTVPVHSLVRLPANLSYDEASTLPCAALTAWNALVGLKPIKAGDYVLLLGTGGVSIFGLQLAVVSGATAIVTSSSDEKLEFAKRLGAHHTINYNKTKNWDEEVLRITGGRGVDHVIEVGGAGTIARSANSARHAGCVDLIGFVAEGANQIPVETVISKALIFRGVLIGSVAQFEAMNRLIEARDIHPIVDKVFPFEEAIDAYAYLDSQKHVGKVVIRVSKN